MPPDQAWRSERDDGRPAAALEPAAAGGPVDAGEGEQSVDPASGQDESHQESLDKSVPRAAMEAGERGPDAETNAPYPISEAGRIWAIMRAGSVASATLVCHRDTWEFVAARAGSHPHFRTPVLEEREEGLVAAVLSGRALVAMLLSLYQIAKSPIRTEGVDELVADADWTMASQVYYKTARVLSRAWSLEGDPVVVTIDDRLRPRP
ncbi:hypothetical protein [Streptomyces fradiae]|uniref:hypothetical protein n=1 Tax=Streptomyces fradiae TaxID=1906 RepID=UPI0037F6C1BB